MHYSSHRQEQSPWPTESIVVKVIQSLAHPFAHKCAYCESPLELREMTLDHFRPAKFARGLDKEYSEQHYWWLAFHWQNLLLSCEDCNKAKSSWFPVKGERANIKSSVVQVRKEKAMLVDPCFDDPRLHLSFDRDGRVVPISDKGATTIEILQLNRKQLIESRKVSTSDLEGDLRKAISLHGAVQKHLMRRIYQFLIRLFTEYSQTPHFVAYRRSYFYDILHDPIYYNLLLKKSILQTEILKELQSQLQSLLKKYNVSRFKAVPVNETSVSLEKRIQIETVRIRNFKGIRELSFDMSSSISEKKNKVPLESWMVLLGENGVGKSSILQAICLALCGQNYIDRMELKPEDLVRIKEDGEDGPPLTADIEVSFKGELKTSMCKLLTKRSFPIFANRLGTYLPMGPSAYRLTAG